jgi:hypothetical protein
MIGANLGLQTEKIISLGFISIVVSKKDTTRGLFTNRSSQTEFEFMVTMMESAAPALDDHQLLLSWELTFFTEKEDWPIES